MIATSVVICTFVRSSVIGNNDLGWRGFLIAQFGLLLLAVDVLSVWRPERRFLSVLLILGAAGSAYEIGINRFYPVLADRGIVPPFSWLGPDRQTGWRNYAYRDAGEWVARAMPSAARVQFNPHTVQNTSAMLYADRQTLAASDTCLSTFGGDPALCPAVIAKLNLIYPLAGQPASSDLAKLCRDLPVDLIAAADTDPAWEDRQSWVWTETPAFANRYLRLFRCR